MPAIELGYLADDSADKTDMMDEKLTSKTDMTDKKLTSKTDIADEKLTLHPDFPTLLTKNIYNLIKLNPKIRYSQMEDNLGVTERTIARSIDWLKENGYINKEHSKIKGEWQLL